MEPRMMMIAFQVLREIEANKHPGRATAAVASSSPLAQNPSGNSGRRHTLRSALWVFAFVLVLIVSMVAFTAGSAA